VAGVVLSECIGRTNWSPLSGMTLIGVTILILVTSGLGDRAAIISSVIVGAAMCVAMAQATDLMLDLKCGYLVGATPKKQQMAQFLGSWIGPIVIIFLIVVLHRAYGLGSDQLPAPQGQALASVIQGILGGDVPMDKYVTGAGLGALLSASGIGGLGVLVGLGFYLPFNIVLTYTIGTILRVVADWKLGVAWSEDVGVPLAAGLIVGEALVGVGYSLVIVFGAS
jgi:putative OPT family oligopeptide transporter